MQYVDRTQIHTLFIALNSPISVGHNKFLKSKLIFNPHHIYSLNLVWIALIVFFFFTRNGRVVFYVTFDLR